MLSSEITPSEGFYVEMNLCKKKWLINFSYNTEKGNKNKHTAGMRKGLDLFSTWKTLSSCRFGRLSCGGSE